MPKKKKEEAPAPSCPSSEGKPDADAQYEAFKRKNEEAKLLQKTFKGIKNIIVVLSGKGGVGKSTVATNLAAAFASKGKTVGILDADVTGPDIPKMLGLEGQKAKVSEKAEPVGEMLAPIVGPLGIKAMSSSFLLQSSDQAVVWRGPMKMGLIKEFFMHVDWGELDYLIIDLPPGTSDEPLTIAQLVKPCTGVVIVTTPQEVSLLDISKAVTFTKLLKMPILGLVENMSGFTCPHCGKTVDIFKKGTSEKAAKEMGIPYLGSIPIDPQITNKGDLGSPFMADKKETPSTKAFLAIVEKVQKVIATQCVLKPKDEDGPSKGGGCDC
jgi:ATP-binding protein involved in chromosome partitioning